MYAGKIIGTILIIAVIILAFWGETNEKKQSV